MKRFAAAMTLSALLVPAVPADAHKSKWFWTERKADKRLMQSYSDVLEADCVGWGLTRSKNGRVRYSHFSCGLSLDDGTSVRVTVETLGKRKASVLYNDEVDIIR